MHGCSTLPLRSGWRFSQHRHLDARAAPGSARRLSPPPRCHHRAGRRRRRRADQAVPGRRWPGCHGGDPGSSSRCGSRAHESRSGLKGVVLGGHGLTTWGLDLAGVRAQLPGPDPPGGGVHPRPGAGRSRWEASAKGSSPCQNRSGSDAQRPWRPCCGGWPPPSGMWSATGSTASRCWTSSPERPRPEWCRSVPPARTPPSAPRCVCCCWTS